jgi:hypothetical protein
VIYPAYCVIKVVNGALVVADGISIDAAHLEFSTDEEHQALDAFAGAAHTGDMVQIGDKVVLRRSC